MTPEILRYRIPDAQATAFIDAYRQAGEVLKQSGHCLGFELLRSSKEAELFLLRIDWDSPEGHLQGFRKSPLFVAFLDAIRAYIPDILEMEHYASIELQWHRS